MLTFNNKIITYNTKWIGDTYTPPEPVELPPYTIRVRTRDGFAPSAYPIDYQEPRYKLGTCTKVAGTDDTYDLHFESLD